MAKSKWCFFANPNRNGEKRAHKQTKFTFIFGKVVDFSKRNEYFMDLCLLNVSAVR